VNHSRKLDAAAAQFKKDQISVLVELGDLIDAADSVETEQGYLKTINQKFSKICPNRHYVLGNHCVDTLKKGGIPARCRAKRILLLFRSGRDFISSFLTPAFEVMASPMSEKLSMDRRQYSTSRARMAERRSQIQR
jgi:hypothetical protein